MKRTLKIGAIVLPVLAMALIMGFTFGGHPSELEGKEYLDYLRSESSGMHMTREMGNYRFEVQYKTVPYQVMNEQQSHDISEAQLAERAASLTPWYHFNVRIGTLEGLGLMESGEANEPVNNQFLYHFVGAAQQDFVLLQGTDTVPCELYHFERNYNLAKHNDIVLAFRKTSTTHEDLTLIYNDQILGTGPLYFHISASDLSDLPTLKTH